jgi:hypothetical protein
MFIFVAAGSHIVDPAIPCLIAVLNQISTIEHINVNKKNGLNFSKPVRLIFLGTD